MIHYKRHISDMACACGQYGIRMEVSTDLDKVDCGRCKRCLIADEKRVAKIMKRTVKSGTRKAYRTDI